VDRDFTVKKINFLTFGLESNFITHSVRSKFSKESRGKIQKRTCKKRRAFHQGKDGNALLKTLG
jgi:hypothetical protein